LERLGFRRLVPRILELTLKKIVAVPFVIGALGLGFVACGGDDEADAFCDKASEVEAAGSAVQDINPQDIDSAKTALADANAKVQEAADAAPDEISDDVNKVASFIDDFSSQLQDVQQPQDFLEIAGNLQGQVADLQEASDNVDAYIADNC
jgi:hypothetical protein